MDSITTTKPLTYMDLANQLVASVGYGKQMDNGARTSQQAIILKAAEEYDDVAVFIFENRTGVKQPYYTIRLLYGDGCSPTFDMNSVDKDELAKNLRMLALYYQYRQAKKGIQVDEVYTAAFTYEDLAGILKTDTDNKAAIFSGKVCSNHFTLFKGISGVKDVDVWLTYSPNENLGYYEIYATVALDKHRCVRTDGLDKNDLVKGLEYLVTKITREMNREETVYLEWYGRSVMSEQDDMAAKEKPVPKTTFADIIMKHVGQQYDELTDLIQDVLNALSNEFGFDRGQAAKLFDDAYRECSDSGYGAVIERAYQLGQLVFSVMKKDFEPKSFAEMSDRTLNEQLYPMVRMAASFIQNIDTILEPDDEAGQQRLAAIGWDNDLKNFLLQALKSYLKYARNQFSN